MDYKDACHVFLDNGFLRSLQEKNSRRRIGYEWIHPGMGQKGLVSSSICSNQDGDECTAVGWDEPLYHDLVYSLSELREYILILLHRLS